MGEIACPQANERSSLARVMHRLPHPSDGHMPRMGDMRPTLSGEYRTPLMGGTARGKVRHTEGVGKRGTEAPVGHPLRQVKPPEILPSERSLERVMRETPGSTILRE